MFGNKELRGNRIGVATHAVVKPCVFIINTPLENAQKLAEPFATKEKRITVIDKLLEKGCYEGAREVAIAKFLEGNADLERRELMYSSAEVEKMLNQAGAVTDYTQIGLTREHYLPPPRRAQLIRKRYMVLDVLYETGLLNQAINTL